MPIPRSEEQIPVYRPVNLDRRSLAGRAYALFRAKYPAIFREASAYQLARAQDDLADHIGALQDSLATGSPALFVDYAVRAQIFFSARHLPAAYVSSGFHVLHEILGEIPEDYRSDADRILKKGIAALKSVPPEPASCIDDRDPLAEVARSYLDALIAADRGKARGIIGAAIAEGVPVADLYLRVFQPVLKETGMRWLVQRLSVAEEHYITASVDAEISRIREEFIEGKSTASRGKTVVLAAVERDLHGIGIRMVADFFEMDGWNTYYVGPNTPAQSFLRAARSRDADVMAVSCTLPSRLPVVHYLVRSVRADPGMAKTKILVGGYPFSAVPGLWSHMGADGYAPDAAEAVSIANRLVGIKS